MNDNRPRTAEQKADPAHWRIGDVVMLHPDALSADQTPHPHAGRLGRIAAITPARPADLLLVTIVAGGGAGKDTHLALQAAMFLGVPEFCVESYEPEPGVTAWRISAEGRRVLVDGMGWPITEASLGRNVSAR